MNEIYSRFVAVLMTSYEGLWTTTEDEDRAVRYLKGSWRSYRWN